MKVYIQKFSYLSNNSSKNTKRGTTLIAGHTSFIYSLAGPLYIDIEGSQAIILKSVFLYLKTRSG